MGDIALKSKKRTAKGVAATKFFTKRSKFIRLSDSIVDRVELRMGEDGDMQHARLSLTQAVGVLVNEACDVREAGKRANAAGVDE